MAEVSTDELKAAVESQHGGTATFVESVPVTETFEGKTVWDGTVAVFNLRGIRQGDGGLCLDIAAIVAGQQSK